MEDMQPGQIISPTSPGGELPIRGDRQGQEDTTAIETQQQPMAASATQTQPTQPVSYSEEPQPYQPEGQSTSPAILASSPTTQPSSPPLQATVDPQPDQPNQATPPALSAAQYVHHEKHALWYGLYVLGTLLLSAVVYFTTKDILSTIIVFVAILGLILFASRKPGVQAYTIDGDSLQIGQKVYYLHDFKAFSVVEEGAAAEVMLYPLKRLFPMVSVYVDPDQIDDLADYLSEYLPFEPHKSDAVDSLLRRIRF